MGMTMDPIGSYCAGTSYKGSGKASINSVLTDLVVKGSTGGFATSSAGKDKNLVYGLAQCRGDVSASDCSACLADAANKLPATCSYQSDARIWYCVFVDFTHIVFSYFSDFFESTVNRD
jgi:hypothetical protein